MNGASFDKELKIISDTTHQSAYLVIYYPTALFYAHFLSGKKSEADRDWSEACAADQLNRFFPRQNNDHVIFILNLCIICTLLSAVG